MQELTDSQFIDLVHVRGITLNAKGDRLQINAPVGALDPGLHRELVRRKTGLLALLRSSDTIPLLPANRDDRIPQTPAQQAMWLIDHFDPGHLAYNIPEAFMVESPIDRKTLQVAIDGLIQRQEILRASFYEDDGELFQSISPDANTQVGFSDLSGLPENDRNDELNKLIRVHAREPFDLTQPPLVHFHLFRLEDERHVIFFNIHHIVADARSLVILRQELGVLYRAALNHEIAVLPKLPLQYADYALWVARRFSGDAMAKQIAYWKSKLSGASLFLELPFARPYPEQVTDCGATTPVVIPAEMREALGKVGREVNATLYMTLFTAFAILLYRRTGQEDFCIGSPVTYRKHIETESLIGLFVNMIAFRWEIKGNLTYCELLTQARTTALEAYENSDLPFQEVVQALKVDPRTPRSPLFQIMFGFEPATALGSDGLVQIDTKPGTARFDLTLQLNETAENIDGSLEYRTDLFSEEDIVELGRQFLEILQQVTLHPEIPILSLEITNKTETKREVVNSIQEDKTHFRMNPLDRITTRLRRFSKGK